MVGVKVARMVRPELLRMARMPCLQSHDTWSFDPVGPAGELKADPVKQMAFQSDEERSKISVEWVLEFSPRAFDLGQPASGSDGGSSPFKQAG